MEQNAEHGEAFSKEASNNLDLVPATVTDFSNKYRL